MHTEMSSRACCSAYFGSLVNKTMPKQTYHSKYFRQGDKRIQDDDSDKNDFGGIQLNQTEPENDTFCHG